ncbi:MAG TPA: class I SAM-dependent methyltransferase [Micromonosporaceae bacterium]
MTDYQAVNRANWDDRVPVHLRSSDFYPTQRFIDDPAYLSHVVAFDLPRLGDISGLRGVHLQCHIGTDTLSLSRLGADMTGLDFSEPAIAAATELAASAGADTSFVVSDVYGALSVLEAGAYDLVYTGVGALCWLPEIRRWAEVVAALLRPGGRLFLREGHPVLWSLEYERPPGHLEIEYAYFETEQPLIFDEPSTYTDPDAVIAHGLTHEWNHGLGEIVTALLEQGMTLTMLEEHRSVPWEAMPGSMSVDEAGEWRLVDRPERLPLTYTLQAVKV